MKVKISQEISHPSKETLSQIHLAASVNESHKALSTGSRSGCSAPGAQICKVQVSDQNRSASSHCCYKGAEMAKSYYRSRVERLQREQAFRLHEFLCCLLAMSFKSKFSQCLWNHLSTRNCCLKLCATWLIKRICILPVHDSSTIWRVEGFNQSVGWWLFNQCKNVFWADGSYWKLLCNL